MRTLISALPVHPPSSRLSSHPFPSLSRPFAFQRACRRIVPSSLHLSSRISSLLQPSPSSQPSRSSRLSQLSQPSHPSFLWRTFPLYLPSSSPSWGDAPWGESVWFAVVSSRPDLLEIVDSLLEQIQPRPSHYF